MGRVTRWDQGAYAVPDSYIDAIQRAGARAAIVLPSDGDEPADMVDLFGGLLLIGGGDVDPARYGAEPHPAVYGVDPERDALEIDLLRATVDAGKPVLAICRGAQILNVACGGTLVQHIPDEPGHLPHGEPVGGDAATHQVKASESSRIARACGHTALTARSHHHQGIDRLGEGLIPVAWSEDGLIEAIERQDGWVVAVQWHPEATAAADPAQQALFDAFAAQVRAQGRS